MYDSGSIQWFYNLHPIWIRLHEGGSLNTMGRLFFTNEGGNILHAVASEHA